MTFFKLRWPYHLIPLGVIFVVCGLVLSGEQNISWAASQQNPYLQTIPTRPPTVEPGPTAEPTPPTEPTPPAEPTLPSDEGNDNEGGDDDDGDEPASGPPPAQASEQDPTEAEEALPPLKPSGVDQPAEINASAPVESQLPQEDNNADELDLTRPQQANSGSEVTPDTTTSGEVSTGTGPDHPDPLATAPAASDANLKLPFYQTGSLLWLYLLGLGVILIISGVYLVKRA
jgi:hypothetical protein